MAAFETPRRCDCNVTVCRCWISYNPPPKTAKEHHAEKLREALQRISLGPRDGGFRQPEQMRGYAAMKLREAKP